MAEYQPSCAFFIYLFIFFETKSRFLGAKIQTNKLIKYYPVSSHLDRTGWCIEVSLAKKISP